MGMLVALSGVGASVRALWMCCVRQSSASSEIGEVFVGSDAGKMLRDFFEGGGAAGGEGGGVRYVSCCDFSGGKVSKSVDEAREVGSGCYGAKGCKARTPSVACCVRGCCDWGV